MKPFSKFRVLIVSLLLVALLAPKGVAQWSVYQAEDFDQLSLVLGSAFVPGHINALVAEKFAQLVRERSGGRIAIEVKAGGALGSEEELIELVSVGAVAMNAVGIMVFSMFTPEYMFFGTHFVFSDFDHVMNVWNSYLGDELREVLLQRGNTIVLGQPVYRGLRHFTANRPIVEPADVAGLRLRLPGVETWIAVWHGLGAAPVPVPLPELYTALLTGVADASEGDMEQLWTFKLHEVQSWLSLTGHHVETGYLTINADLFGRLNRPTQRLLKHSAHEATIWGTRKVQEREAELLRLYSEKIGGQVVEANTAAFREAAGPIIEELFRTRWPVTTWSAILALR